MVKKRKGVGLALSGGGYRASLFHLGAAQRLHEIGLLQTVTDISSVSGGSILSAHLADSMMNRGNKKSLQFSNWEKDVADPFVKFVAKDIRTKLILKFFFWGQINPSLRANALKDSFYQGLTKLSLKDLSQSHVNFTFLSTDMKYGTAWHFTPERMFTWREKNRKEFSIDNISVATAVAASACFPPVFGPLELKLVNDRTAYLTDGGVYDNSGMEPIWRKCETVLVSDAGKPFEYREPRSYLGRVYRYTSIAMEQIRSLRHRELVGILNSASAEEKPPYGTLWRLNSKKKNYLRGASSAFKAFVEKRNTNWFGFGVDASLKIQNIRTDLDSFSDAESKILINHGYFYAEIAIARHLSLTTSNQYEFAAPYPDYTDDKTVINELLYSDKRLMYYRKWKRFWSM